MIFKVDLENKTITPEGLDNLSIFYEHLKKLIPRSEWSDWKIQVNAIQYWYYPTSPPIINPYVPDYPIYKYEPTLVSSIVIDEFGVVLNDTFNTTITNNITLIEFKDE
jgi:hypothetical protein